MAGVKETIIHLGLKSHESNFKLEPHTHPIYFSLEGKIYLLHQNALPAQPNNQCIKTPNSVMRQTFILKKIKRCERDLGTRAKLKISPGSSKGFMGARCPASPSCYTFAESEQILHSFQVNNVFSRRHKGVGWSVSKHICGLQVNVVLSFDQERQKMLMLAQCLEERSCQRVY